MRRGADFTRVCRHAFLSRGCSSRRIAGPLRRRSRYDLGDLSWHSRHGVLNSSCHHHPRGSHHPKEERRATARLIPASHLPVICRSALTFFIRCFLLSVVHFPRLSARFSFVALIVCAASSFGGEIYGTIKEDGKPIAKDVEVTIKLNGESTGKTDEFGSYRILVSETGPCSIAIKLRDTLISGQIQSYSKPTRFDMVVEKNNGQYSLQRQ